MAFSNQHIFAATCSIALMIFITYVPLASSVPDDSGWLKAHNEARAEVGIPPLEWSEKLSDYAQDYANQRIEDCAMEHSKSPYAENLASGLGMTGEVATKYWCTEKDEWDQVTNRCTGAEVDGCRHYTQIVWRETTHVGCARAQCKNGDMYCICEYEPSGINDGTERPF